MKCTLKEQKSNPGENYGSFDNSKMDRQSTGIAYCLVFSLFLTATFSCSTTVKIADQSRQIIGKWTVESIFSGEMESVESIPDGEMTIEFRRNNTAVIFDKEEGTETFRYEVRDGNVYDLDKNEDPPMGIMSVSKDELVLAIDIEIDYIEIHLKRAKK